MLCYANKDTANVLNEDFFDFYERCYSKKKFDLIFGNPPYIRYQYLTEKQREIQSQILISHGMKSNKLINAWVGFVVACVQMLSENGRIALVLPAEILQVAYAEDLRLFLSNQFSRITLMTFEKLVFSEIEQKVLYRETEGKYSLEKVTLPLIGRSSHAHGIYFTEEDWEVNAKEGKRAMLINFPQTPYEKYPKLHKRIKIWHPLCTYHETGQRSEYSDSSVRILDKA